MAALTVTQPDITEVTAQDGPVLTIDSAIPIELAVVNGQPVEVIPPPSIELTPGPIVDIIITALAPIELAVGAVIGTGGGGTTLEQGTPYDDNDYLYVVLGEDGDWESRRTSRVDFSEQTTGPQTGTKPTDLATVQGLSYS